MDPCILGRLTTSLWWLVSGTPPIAMDSTPKKKSLIRHVGRFSWKKRVELQPLRRALPGRDTAIGEKRFGKAYVSCALRGKNSKWGKLGDKDAAVLQLLIDPRQDDGFKLSELVLELSFAETDPQQAPSAGPASVVGATAIAQEPSLILLEPPSPKYLKGKTAVQHGSREILLQPEVGAGGVSIGGIGVKSTKDKDIERSWRFHSHWANNEFGLFTNAQWTWKAVAENPDIEDVGALFAGVILQHPGQPFYLTCKVSGKLVGLGKKLRYGTDEDRLYYTLVYPKLSQENLDKEAKQLQDDIVDLISRAAASK
jgi:hypothetical protein